MRPDSVQSGSLVGPYRGRVVDKGTGEAVSGALVYASWGFETGLGMTTPAGFYEAVTTTNADGRYQVSSLAQAPREGVVADWADSRGSTRLSSFHLVIYKRGYVAYRSDRRYRDFGPRQDFAQRRNRVELRKWGPADSHARHLRYLGGGDAIRALTEWERAAAARELSGEPAPSLPVATLPQQPTGVVAAELITDFEIAEVTGFEGTFETGPLGDDPASATYSSQHFQAVGRGQEHDLAVRLWSEGAERRFAQLQKDLPGVKRTDNIADGSMLAEEKGFFGLAYLDKKRGAVVLITCGRALCKDAEVMNAVAQKSYAQLTELWKGAPP